MVPTTTESTTTTTMTTTTIEANDDPVPVGGGTFVIMPPSPPPATSSSSHDRTMMTDGDADVDPTAVDGRHRHQEERVRPQHHHAGLSSALLSLRGWTSDALSYIARCKSLSIKSLTIPSQVRYAGYFANMLDGVTPSSTPLTLKRIIMSKAPKFGRRLVPTTPATSSSSSSAAAAATAATEPDDVVVAGMGLCTLPPTLQGRESYIHRGGVRELLPIDRRPSILFGLRRIDIFPRRHEYTGRRITALSSHDQIGTED